MSEAILLSLVLALALIPSAPTAYQVAEHAHARPQRSRTRLLDGSRKIMPVCARSEADGRPPSGGHTTTSHKDYTAHSSRLGRAERGRSAVPALAASLGVLVLTHEAFPPSPLALPEGRGGSRMRRRWRTSTTPRADWGRRPRRSRTSTPTPWRCTTTKSSSSPRYRDSKCVIPPGLRRLDDHPRRHDDAQRSRTCRPSLPPSRRSRR